MPVKKHDFKILRTRFTNPHAEKLFRDKCRDQGISLYQGLRLAAEKWCGFNQ